MSEPLIHVLAHKAEVYTADVQIDLQMRPIRCLGTGWMSILLEMVAIAKIWIDMKSLLPTGHVFCK